METQNPDLSVIKQICSKILKSHINNSPGFVLYNASYSDINKALIFADEVPGSINRLGNAVRYNNNFTNI